MLWGRCGAGVGPRLDRGDLRSVVLQRKVQLRSRAPVPAQSDTTAREQQQQTPPAAASSAAFESALLILCFPSATGFSSHLMAARSKARAASSSLA